MSDPISLLVAVCAGFGLALFFSRVKSKFRTKNLPFHSHSESSKSVTNGSTPKINVPPLKSAYHYGSITTLSPRVVELLKAAQVIAATSSTVLIEGESGTGKEKMARLIHEKGRRALHPFIPVHAAALPETLLETELFGHERGSFTGAVGQRKGRFEMAHKGTLFLDEIGELSPLLQVKLLRVIQEKSFERVGGNEKIDVDVRIIAATNRNLSQLVREAKFREDLYYRLNVVALRLIPLRERKEDIPQLIGEMLERQMARLGKTINGYTEDFLSHLTAHTFSGNIRELENMIERAVVFCSETRLNATHLRFDPEDWVPFSLPTLKENHLEFFQKRIDRNKILEAYARANGNKAQAARILGMRESTFRYHLKRAFEVVSQGA